MRSPRWACCRSCARRPARSSASTSAAAAISAAPCWKPAKHGRREFGRVVVARDFGEALEARLAELPRLTRYRPVRFVGLEADVPTLATIAASASPTRGGERVLQARLLVAADGTRSGVRDALGIGTDEHDYGADPVRHPPAHASARPMAPLTNDSATTARPRCCRAATATTA